MTMYRCATPKKLATNRHGDVFVTHWKEIDPTSIFAIFYIIFFRIMFEMWDMESYYVRRCYALKKNKLYEGDHISSWKVLFCQWNLSSIFWASVWKFLRDLHPVVAKRRSSVLSIVINPLEAAHEKRTKTRAVPSCHGSDIG